MNQLLTEEYIKVNIKNDDKPLIYILRVERDHLPKIFSVQYCSVKYKQVPRISASFGPEEHAREYLVYLEYLEYIHTSSENLTNIDIDRLIKRAICNYNNSILVPTANINDIKSNLIADEEETYL